MPDPTDAVDPTDVTGVMDGCCAVPGATMLSEGDAAALAAMLKALADPVRLRLLSIIASAAAGEVCACDLPASVDRSQPTVSHHLSQLVAAGVLEREQRGRWAWFRLRPGNVEAICAAIGACCSTTSGARTHSALVDSMSIE